MLKNVVSGIFILILIFSLSGIVYANSIEIKTLVDVVRENNTSLLIGASEAQLKKYAPDGKVQNSILAFLVNFGESEILFDTGLQDGHVVNEIIKNNRKPEDIKIILLTHLHGDHFGGLVDSNGNAAFKNAKIYVSKKEYSYWTEEIKNQKVIDALKLYEGRLNLFDFGDEVVSGVKAIDTIGHTPGHTSFLINFENEKLLVVGDVIHFMDVQLPAPDVAVKYDVDPEKAIQSRKFIFDYASEKNIPIAGMHMKLPGVINIKKSGEGYEKF